MAKSNNANNGEDLTPKQIADLLAQANAKAVNSLKDYNEVVKTIKEQQRQILKNTQDMAEADKVIANAKAKQKEMLKGITSESERRAKMNSKEYQTQIAIVKSHRHLKKELNDEVKVLKQVNKDMATALNSSNLMAASIRSIGKGAKGIYNQLVPISKELLKEMKTVQLTEQSMGILSKQSDAFRMNLYKAAGTTTQLGVSAGDLAKMQGAYSNQIGRSVQLSEQGLVAMAEMAKGTMLGADGAAEMVANMDNFGISAIGTHKIMEEMMNTSSKMGVNSVKVTANLKKNMQLANRFHFKDGVKGMMRLAASAAKVRINMDGIATMADKVFRPEGAIEMAARLQTMGGEFAKMADPFSLMFKARNDFEGFTNDIIDASKEFSKFNAETGEFEISGLGYDRIREIADITGMAADDIAQMSRDAAKIDVIESQVGMGITDEDNIDFISSIATFDQATKEYKVMLDGQETSVKNLKDADVKRLRDEKATLKERAKQAQTFYETWKNLKDTFKTLLFPILNGLSEGLKEPLGRFMEWAQESGAFEKLFESAKKIGQNIGKALKGITKFATTIVDFIAENPIASLVGAIAGMGLFKYLQWFMNGKALRAGFMSGGGRGRGGKGFGGSMMGNMMGFGKGGPMRNAKAGWLKARRGGKGFGGKMLGGMKGFGGGMGGMKGFGGGMGGMGLGLAGMGAGMLMDYGRSQMADPNSTVGKAMGVGSSALQGAGMGAMFGPWGALIGGLLGAGYGAYKEFNFDDNNSAFDNVDKYGDVIMRSGQAPIGIDKNDDILAAKKGGAVDKAVSNAGSTSGNITFGPLTINGKIELTGEGASGELDLDDPIFMRDLSRVIQEEVRKSIGGGKLNPNPI